MGTSPSLQKNQLRGSLHQHRLAADHPVVVVVDTGAGTALLLLLFDRTKIPSPITTPAPTNQSNGGLMSLAPCACLTPAAGAAGNGPVSADIAGSGAIIRAALTNIETIDLFTLCSPSWVILLRCLPSHANTVNKWDSLFATQG